MKKYVRDNSNQMLIGSTSKWWVASGSPRSKKGKEPSMWGKNMLTRHTFNTVTIWIDEGGKTISSRKRYACQVMIIEGSPSRTYSGKKEILQSNVTFFRNMPQAYICMITTPWSYRDFWKFKSNKQLIGEKIHMYTSSFGMLSKWCTWTWMTSKVFRVRIHILAGASKRLYHLEDRV